MDEYTYAQYLDPQIYKVLNCYLKLWIHYPIGPFLVILLIAGLIDCDFRDFTYPSFDGLNNYLTAPHPLPWKAQGSFTTYKYFECYPYQTCYYLKVFIDSNDNFYHNFRKEWSDIGNHSTPRKTYKP